MARCRAICRHWPLWLSLLLLAIASLVAPGGSVKHENFKTCAQSGFCSRNRAYADKMSAKGASSTPYEIDTASLRFADGQLHAVVVKKSTAADERVRLPLVMSFLESGAVRVVVDEERRINGDIELRHDSQARKQRYNGAAQWALTGDGLQPSKSAVLVVDNDNGATATGLTTVAYGPDGRFQAVVRHAPLSVEFQRDGETHVHLNARGFLNVEHWRAKTDDAGAGAGAGAADADDQSTWWEETFGGNTDSKPRGPESVGVDISFPGYGHVYGIPEHADSLSLKETRGGSGNHADPYRMYNADVFEYELQSPMTLYGSIPFMQAHRANSTVGVFWLNAAETWVDIVKTRANPLALGVSKTTATQTHWFSESGQLDVFVFLGPSAAEISKTYGELTGYTQLPQQFAVGYHQCRWNYVTDEDVREVDRKFDEYQIPYDVIWLDIEYTDGKKYFTWDALTFPDPEGMEQQLDASGRKLVVIVDPHIKSAAQDGYTVDEELTSRGFGVRSKDGSLYEGWCWPGASHWVDCFSGEAARWWAGLFRFDRFKGTLANVFVWNDMNEPSVFNGPETTMPKDNLHDGNWEHRDVHNLNGLTLINATYEGLLARDSDSGHHDSWWHGRGGGGGGQQQQQQHRRRQRPFILTRSFFAGAQRASAMWTGDNQATWEHLAMSLPMVLNNGVAGFPFAGADVGGFFNNPSKELLTRWYQAGIWYPFFRAHAHIDTRRREPYLVGEPYVGLIAQAIRLRYQLLPAWYTAFHEASVNGTPIVRPQYYVHGGDERGFAVDDQLYLGSTGLLAKPVVTEGAVSVDVYLADDERYYDYFDYTVYSGRGTVSVPAPLDRIPLLMQGGHIIPRRDRPRRSAALMAWDPYTLVVVADRAGRAEGSLYVDDGQSFDYLRGAYIHRRFTYERHANGSATLKSEEFAAAAASAVAGGAGAAAAAFVKTMADVRVDKIVVVDAPREWQHKTSAVVVGDDGRQTAVPLRYYAQDGRAAYAVVKNGGGIGGGIGRSWRIDM